jgi:CDP-glucose 4,6-dehydratase
VIGGGDWAMDRIIPDVWRAWRQGVPLGLRNPHATRPWQHVLDALSGYLLYVERLAGAGGQGLPRALNFSPLKGEGLDVAAIVVAMTRALGGMPEPWQPDTRPTPHEAASLSLDSSLAEQSLGWRARLPIQRALDITAQWYARHAAGEDARSLCLEQIALFEGLPA